MSSEIKDRLQRRLHAVSRLFAISLKACIYLSVGNSVTVAGTHLTLEQAAQGGDPDAQFKLANAYMNGGGLPKNYKKALFWLTSAGNKHHGPAQLSIGVAYYYGGALP